uniref:Uncharacterized LOC100177134 n=1 Tax=Ciona intestinalis TaxID=7719 RepID=H2Y2I5_CIOIN|nr:uncharacterized protein LOC100177134 [Ciona intestinalis]|eukprot:XP_002123064.1 uncharacterized protein LOC100177134 [Ciona intestinalis]
MHLASFMSFLVLLLVKFNSVTGLSCSSSFLSCASGQTCCSGICMSSCYSDIIRTTYSLGVGAIVGIAIGGLVFTGLCIGVCVYCCCACGRAANRGAPQPAATFVATVPAAGQQNPGYNAQYSANNPPVYVDQNSALPGQKPGYLGQQPGSG